MKLRTLVASTAAAAALAVGIAAPVSAAPGHVRGGNGWLTATITTGGVTTVTRLQPGKAVQLAQTTCANVVAHPPAVQVLPVVPGVTPIVVGPADLTVDAVRVNFPAPTVVCTGVTLTSTHGVAAAEGDA